MAGRAHTNVALVPAAWLEAESFIKRCDMEKLARGNLELFAQTAKVLFRKVFFLVLEGVENGDNLLWVPAITFKNSFESGSIHLTSRVTLVFQSRGLLLSRKPTMECETTSVHPSFFSVVLCFKAG